MKPLPLPVRLAAGLVATAVEQARALPRRAVELPVTAVSQALQASMRVQQRVTELAIKGDRVLGTLRPVEERPSWATFDDEVDPPRRNGSSTVTELRPQSARPAPAPPTAERRAATPVTADVTADIADDIAGAATRAAEALPAEAPGSGATPEVSTAERGGDRTGTATAERSGDRDGTAADPPGADGPADEPEAVPGYANMTIPQLRGRLRHLGLAELQELLEWENAHGARPPFVTMLSNRITTVRGT
jgi:hypothetical protein